MNPLEFNEENLFEPRQSMKQWLILQAQLQQNFAKTEKAITLLELVEAVYGPETSTGLMLCRAWSSIGEIDPLEKKVEHLLAHEVLTIEQRAAVYYCLSAARWKAGQKVGARKVHRLYLSLISQIEKERNENVSD